MSNSTKQLLDLDLNYDKLIASLQVEEKATAAAHDEDRPKTESTEADDNERYIVGHFRTQLGKLKDWARSCYKSQNSAREDIDLQQELRALKRLKDTMIAEINGVLSAYYQKLKTQRLKERKQLKSLNGFRLLNKLSREPRYPESKLYHYAIVILIGAIEAVLNSVIFAKGSDFGLLGGFWEALLVATVNVGIAYLAGRFALTHTHHIKPFKQTVAWFGLAIYGSATSLFNLMAAHYRVALETAPDNAIVAAMQMFSHSPLGIESFQAWMLFFLGLIASLITFFKAYGEDDHYPGYGSAHREYEKGKHGYEALKHETLDHVSEIRLKHIMQVDTTLRSARKALAALADLNDQTAKTNDHLIAKFSAIENSAADMVKAYRVANERIRHTPPPAFFSVQFTFAGEDRTLDLIDLNALAALYQTNTEALHAMNDVAQTVSDEIQKQGKSAIEDANALFHSIEQMAEQELNKDEKEQPLDLDGLQPQQAE